MATITDHKKNLLTMERGEYIARFLACKQAENLPFNLGYGNKSLAMSALIQGIRSVSEVEQLTHKQQLFVGVKDSTMAKWISDIYSECLGQIDTIVEERLYLTHSAEEIKQCLENPTETMVMVSNEEVSFVAAVKNDLIYKKFHLYSPANMDCLSTDQYYTQKHRFCSSLIIIYKRHLEFETNKKLEMKQKQEVDVKRQQVQSSLIGVNSSLKSTLKDERTLTAGKVKSVTDLTADLGNSSSSTKKIPRASVAGRNYNNSSKNVIGSDDDIDDDEYDDQGVDSFVNDQGKDKCTSPFSAAVVQSQHTNLTYEQQIAVEKEKQVTLQMELDLIEKRTKG